MTQELGNNYYKSGWQPSIEFDEENKYLLQYKYNLKNLELIKMK